MKEIAKRIWLEPAAFLGLLATVALAVGALATGSDWTWEAIVAVLAPLLTSLGIRQLVTPVTPPVEPDAGTTLHRP